MCQHCITDETTRTFEPSDLQLNGKPLAAGQNRCDKCNGSGKYYGRGETVNGKFTGTVGKCYGCHGRGWQTLADRIRCHVYWTHHCRVQST